ncbi:ornithine cyclodeaminase family protein [Nocardioides sp.]|uniref:ornithine cyclodeaminase family protein n=1 Tax=Nocardioides sp. TaxID=35761 RepID=UPI00199B1F61|nr:ornithine cyclodeaminase family protein [Nocardioides sp.]MBC7276837.1 ornithine cyclodeaminase family protein [Nocardioides sp.]
MPVRILSAADVRSIFTPRLALESQREAFTRLGAGEAVQPPRLLVPGPDASVSFCYSSRIAPDAPAVSKFGSVNPANAARGLGAVHSVITVLDPETGAPRAIINGDSVTGLRTSAATTLAMQQVAPDAKSILVVGTGAQARAHLDAFAVTHPDAELQIHGRNRAAAAELAESHRATAKHDLEPAVRSADIVVLCTSSLAPVIEDAWVTDGTTVASVGSFAPDRVELPPSLLGRSTVLVDHRPSAMTDSGPVVDAIASGLVTPDRITDLGALLTGADTLDRAPADVLVYLSVGVGVQDAAAAEVILAAAEARDAGTQAHLS